MNLDMRFYLSLFLRRLPYFLVFLAMGSAAGITLATVLPPVYEAEASLLVESATIDTDGGINIDPQEQLSIIQQRVLTRASILEMVNRLDVYAPVDGGARERLAADEIVEDMRERISIRVSGGSDQRGSATATIVRVSFTAPTAALAADVANEVVDLMLQENIDIRGATTTSTVAFFRTRLADLERELVENRAEYLSFQQANPNSLPDSLDFRRSQQAGAQERLLDLQRDETRLRDQRDTLVRVYEQTGQVLGAAAEQAARLTPEQRQLQDLSSQLTVMELTLAPTHPRVVQLRNQIAAVETVVNAQQQSLGEIDPTLGALSEYDLRLADLDGQLEFIANQQAQIRAELEELRVSIEATPGNAIALEAMERDYANISIQYDQVAAQLAEAETSEVVDRTGRGERISVIENAIRPREPNSPNRPILAAAGIGGGFMLGLAFIVLLELLNSSVRRPVDLTKKLGITPLGAIPHIRTRWEILRRRSIIVAAFGVILIALPAGLYFVHTQITPLDVALNGVLVRLGLPLIS
jgi:uncharacterized protein involved in exopolysaccharide biosynthesis